jgi:hypothetical protein
VTTESRGEKISAAKKGRPLIARGPTEITRQEAVREMLTCPPPAAETPDPLLTVEACRGRLPIGSPAVREMLRAPESDPCHLPSVFVPPGGSGGGYRVRPEDLERLVVRISPEARSLAHSRCKWRRGYPSPGRGRGIKAQWADGKRDKEAHNERNRQDWRSPKTAVERADKSTRGRHGHELSPEGRARVAGRALSRAQRASDRSRERRKLEERMLEMWPGGKTVAQIAEELGTTPSNVKEMRRRLSLPPRRPGRPPKK